MATEKKANSRSWYLVVILVALLVGAGAIASGAFAASPASLPVAKAKAPAAAPAPVCVQPPLSMMAWYPLDETSGTTMNDFMGAYNGTYFNNPAINSGQYVLNSRQFNGSNQWGEANPGPDFGTSSFTIDAWVNVPAGSGSPNVIVDKRDVTPIGYEMFVINGFLGVQVADGIGSPGYANYLRTTGPQVNDGQWHFVAAVVQRSPYVVTLWVDATSQSFSNNPHTGSVTNARGLRVGRHWPNNADPSDHYFLGGIDEVELFNRVLTGSELNSIFTAQTAGKCKSPPTNTPTNTPIPTATNPPCGPNSNYAVTQSTGAIVPGTTNIGNNCDDCTTNIALPFSYSLYGTPYNSANVSSNGSFQFVSNNATYINGCLPDATFDTTIFPFWDDLYTSDAASGEGVFTSISGAAPCRVFNIEWRTVYCCTGGTPINDFEVRLYEGQSKFDIVYGNPMSDRSSATIGVQNGTGPQNTQFVCNTAGPIGGTMLTFAQPPCGTPLPSCATATPTPGSNLSIIVLKINDVTGNPIPGWPMTLHQGPSCTGPVLQTGTTESDGMYDFQGLGAGDYSVEEASQDGWTPVSGSCQSVTLTGSTGVVGNSSNAKLTSPSKPAFSKASTFDFNFTLQASVPLTTPTLPPNTFTSTPTPRIVGTNTFTQPPFNTLTSTSTPPPFNTNTSTATQFVITLTSTPTPRLSTNTTVPSNTATNSPTVTPTPTHPCTFPSAGSDTLNTAAQVVISITGVGTDTVNLSGPSTVQRQNPCVGCGPGGRTTIQTEMVAMNLTGNSGVLGPVQIHESPSLVSAGQISEQMPGVNFPADSFFDIFVEVQTSSGVLHTVDPIHMQSVINCIPPVGGVYIPPTNPNIPLYNSAGQIVGYIQHANHQVQGTPTSTPTSTRTPCVFPTAGTDTISTSAQVVIAINGVGTDTVNLYGPSTVQRQNPCLGCGPGGRTTIQTEMIAMNLTGSSAVLGPVTIRESPTLVSAGQISQQTPGVDFPADSFFDIFVEVQTSSGVLHTQDPIHMQSVINCIPPYGSMYIPPTNPNLPLYNSAGQQVGTIQHANHTIPTPTNTPTRTPCTFPTAGTDSMGTTAQVVISVTGVGTDTVNLSGPSTVQRQNPCVGCGPGGRTTIQTEMIAMNLTGSSAVLGPVVIRESPSLVSAGQISEQTPGVNFPADSFFDVFVEVQTSSGLLHTQDPIHMQTVIYCIPPYGAIYIPPTNPNIPLYNSAGQLVGYIKHANHTIPTPISTPTITPTRTATPCVFPAAGTDTMSTIANVVISINGVGTDNVTLSGPSTVQRQNPCVGCGPGGRTTIQTEMVYMNLTGSSGVLGPIQIHVAPTPPSLGQISEQTPGVNFPADSFFDIFVEVQTSQGVFHTQDPIHMQSVINCIPPYGSMYIPPTNPNLPLYNSAGQQVGTIQHANHQIPTLTATPTRTPCVFPSAGIDTIGTTANVTVDITGVGTDNVTLSGPSTVQRQNPCIACGPGGRTTIQTEMIAMNLTGNSALFGPMTIRESPTLVSPGQISQQSPGVDFPADSFFDIFVEVQTSQGVLHTIDPIHMQSVIYCIPPYGSIYIPPTQPSIPLYNSAGQVVGHLQHANHQIPTRTATPTHTPCVFPPAGTDTLNTVANVVINITGVGTDNVTLSGPSTVQRQNPCVGCGPGGRTTIQTEMIAMNLTGSSGVLGPVVIRESPTLASLGQITQQTPGVDFPADSFFDIFVEVQTSQGVFHTQSPIHMQSVIDCIPPIGSVYIPPTNPNLPLYNSAGQQVGTIQHANHQVQGTPTAQPTDTPTATPTCVFPAAGDDSFPSGAQVVISVNGVGTDTVNLNGPTTIHRDNPCVGCGPSGRTTINTQMTQLDLSGNSGVFGPVQIHVAPTPPSLGRITQQTPGVDFPADSFFDIFVEIQTSQGVLHNITPIHMQSVINCIPPIRGFYIPPTGPDIALYNSAGQQVGFLRHAHHVVLPPREILITFRNHPNFSVTVLKLNDATNQPIANWPMTLHSGLNCTGPVVATGTTDSNGLHDFTDLTPGNYSVEEAQLNGWTPVSGSCQAVTTAMLMRTKADKVTSTSKTKGGSAAVPATATYPPAGDDTFPSGAQVVITLNGQPPATPVLNGPVTVHRSDPCDSCGLVGLASITTSLQMTLTGDTSFGPVHIRESPSRPSLGRITEQQPRTYFPADSFFDIFVEMDTPMGVLHNEQPIHMQSVINSIPPTLALYIPPTQADIALYNTAGQIVGYIRHAVHVTLPPHEIFLVFRNHPQLSITVIKINDATNQPIPGWTMRLHSGGCSGPVLQTGTTDSSGLYDFTDLAPGDYSVEEVLQTGWTPVSGACQAVTLTASALGKPGDSKVNSTSRPNNASSGSWDSPLVVDKSRRAFAKPGQPFYPGAGDDTFPSGGNVTISINGAGTDNVTLNGPSTVHRNDPTPIGGGRVGINTEMTNMDMTGSSIFGPVHIRESPTRQSLGRISQQQPGVDFPSDSFFDIFVEIDTSQGTLHNEQPIHMQTVINAIPPTLAVYIPPTVTDIPLLNSAGQVVGFIRHAVHVVLPPREIIIVFRNRPPATITPTFTPTNTPTNTPTRTSIPTNTFTNTPTNTPTRTSIPTNTFTNTPTNTPTRTSIPTNTFTNTPTNTSAPTNTFTNTPRPTNTSTFTNTPINTFTFTPRPTMTSTPTPTTGCPQPPGCTATPTATCVPGTPGCSTDTPTPCVGSDGSPCTPTPTSTPNCGALPCTATPTVTCTPGLIVHVTWQGISQPGPRNVLPISITLKIGALEVNYPSGNTDANGNRVIPLNGLPPGEPYVWRVKGPNGGPGGNTTPGYLANSGQGVIPAAGVCLTTLEAGTMRAGDVNNDNVVNATDFNALRLTNGKSCGQSGYDGRADFNNDCVVNVQDFNLLRSNFGLSGAPPIRPTGYKPKNAPGNVADTNLRRNPPR